MLIGDLREVPRLVGPATVELRDDLVDDVAGKVDVLLAPAPPAK